MIKPINFREWTDERIKDEVKQLKDSIYKQQCSGKRDFMLLQVLKRELIRRKINKEA